jgi:hypothetical protein
VNEERLERLLNAAREYYHTKDDILYLRRDHARRQYRETLDLLELECTPEQWAKVLAMIELQWP